ncbi:MAG: helix-turn-helix domain-containing protein [Planctomycetaceae bacterium]
MAPRQNQIAVDENDSHDSSQASVHIHLDRRLLREIVGETLAESLAILDWPAGRIALDEAEAAAACGVGRHVLRDLRLSGAFTARRLGKKIVYTRNDLLAALEGGKK